jgi:hypothetical protein
MLFDQFRVPRTALLNRTGDVSESGVYVSPFKDKKKRLGELILNIKSPKYIMSKFLLILIFFLFFFF